MPTARGVAASTLAAILFGMVFYLSGKVPASAEVIFGWRMLITLACYVIVLSHPRPRALLREAWSAVTRTPWLPPAFLLLTTIVGIQLWLFSWAPQHGHALDASLGFLLLPLVMVVSGRVALKDHVTPVQWIAVGIAAAAITIKVALTPEVSWVTVVICLGYPTYFVLRRRLGINGPMSFGLEVAVLAVPAATAVLIADETFRAPDESALLVLLGLAGAAAMAAYLASASLLTLPVFGLLGYLEPVGLVAVALLLEERMEGADLAVYGLLALALVVLAQDAFRHQAPLTPNPYQQARTPHSSRSSGR